MARYLIAVTNGIVSPIIFTSIMDCANELGVSVQMAQRGKRMVGRNRIIVECMLQKCSTREGTILNLTKSLTGYNATFAINNANKDDYTEA